MKIFLLLLTLIFVATGAIAYAANTATPGEALYPVKVNVNENLESAIALDTESQAQVQAKIFAERLEEADRLTENGMVDSETENKLRQDIAVQFEKTYALINEVEAKEGLAEASLARAIMQNAIDYHMSDYQLVLPSVSRDVDVYSKILTQTLIETAVQES